MAEQSTGETEQILANEHIDPVHGMWNTMNIQGRLSSTSNCSSGSVMGVKCCVSLLNIKKKTPTAPHFGVRR